MRVLRPSLTHLLGVVASIGTLFTALPAIAAERVVLKYGPFQESISVADLTTLAETGNAPSSLGIYLRLANKDPRNVQQALTQEVQINAIVLDRALNNPIADVLLDEVGKTIRTPAGGANRQALRSALVLSASKDGKLSLIEVIQNYPTREVVVEGDRLVATYRQLSEFEGQLRKVLGLIELIKIP